MSRSQKAWTVFALMPLLWASPRIVGAAIPANERAALIALYNSTTGNSWTINTGWKTPPLDVDGFAMPGTEWNWFGVTIVSDHVTEIKLGSNNLVGSLPAQLGNLTNLVNLAMSSNHLSNSIPMELGLLSNLVYLNLSFNELTGSIPPWLGNITGLRLIALNRNQLSGNIPSGLGNLTNLRNLTLDRNQLNGSIPPEFGNLTNLSSLSLFDNQLIGSLPAGLGNLSNLKYMQLSWNQLSGSIPPELGILTSLVILELANNQLSGAIPSELGNISSLTDLELDGNRLSGSIPVELGALAQLQSLILSDNLLTGSVPAALGGLTHLVELYLDSNGLIGAIPGSLINLTHLIDDDGFDLRYNGLTTSDAALRTFLNSKQDGGDWQSTQTVAPASPYGSGVNSTTIQASWTPITYTGDSGGYRLYYSTSSGGPYNLYGITPDKLTSSMLVAGLTAGTPYYFVMETFTYPHASNQNTIISERSAEFSATPQSGCVSPSITTQPESLTVSSGGQAMLSVKAAGTQPFNYQWYQGASGDRSNPIAGATEDYFVTRALYTATSYWVLVGNACGTASSNTAMVTVLPGGPIISAIASKTGKPGSIATIKGSGFSSLKKSNVIYFGGGKARIKKAGPASLQVIIPKGLRSGKAYEVYLRVNGLWSNVVMFKVK